MISRIRIILIIISNLVISKGFSQNFTHFNHKYTQVTKYLTLKFIDSTHYKLKTSMYGDSYITGKYKVESDILCLISFSLESSYPDSLDYMLISRAFNKFIIEDSILIPTLTLEEKFLRQEPKYKKDIDSIFYAQTDGHVNQYIKLRKGNRYQYWSRSDVGPAAISNGTFQRIKDEIFFKPSEGAYYLSWFCSNNRMIFVRNLLVGVSKSDKEKNDLVYYEKRKQR